MPELHDSIVRLYDTVFNRVPDADGLRFWDDSAHHGTTLDVMAGQFVTAPEFAATYGQPDSTSFVQSMYSNVLDRPGEAEGVSFWVYGLDHGLTSRADVVVAFSESAEHIANLAAPAPIVMVTETVWVAPVPAPTVDVSAPGQTPLPAGSPPLYTGYGDGDLLTTGANNGPHTFVSHLPNTAILGGNDNDVLVGGPGHSGLAGGAGNDTMYGGPDTTTLVGGPGADFMVGGSGADVFVYQSKLDVSDFGTAINEVNGDFINGFQIGVDLLDFRAMHLAYRGQGAFVADGQPQLRFDEDYTFRLNAGAHVPGSSHIYMDVNGDAVADAQMSVFGAALTDASFLI